MSDDVTAVADNQVRRCPNCDSVVGADDTRCLMCGVALTPSPTSPPSTPEPSVPIPEPELEPDEELVSENSEQLVMASEEPESAELATEPEPTEPPDDQLLVPDPQSPLSQPTAVFESTMREKQSPVVALMTAVAAVFIIILGALVLRFQGPVGAIALYPTETPIPPTITFTPTITPVPTDTPAPTAVPTQTPIPTATPTLEPPIPHVVSAGETLIGLALRYRVSIESIAETNGFSPDAPLQVDQRLQIPLPTPTPPLTAVSTEINGETVIADPTDCERYEIVAGDSIVGIASRYDINLALFMQVNRMDDQTIIQPGDTICIPEIVYAGGILPTPGPSPTPAPTEPPPGPQLLYPIADAVIDPPEGIVTLQWAAVKNLADDEWYMVELVDMAELDDLPHRGFTRDNAFQLPSSWRPDKDESHQMRWRVSIIRVTDWRADGLPVYTFAGNASQPAYFTWLGAVPTPTPTPTATPTATPLPQS